MAKNMIWLAAIWCAISVAMGAFGAHEVKGHLAETYEPAEASSRLDNWKTAANYQMAHGLGMLAIGIFSCVVLGNRRPENVDSTTAIVRGLTVAWLCFLAGSLIFSGCLYAMVLGGPRVLGAVVPIGGSLQLIGWLVFAYSAKRFDPQAVGQG